MPGNRAQVGVLHKSGPYKHVLSEHPCGPRNKSELAVLFIYHVMTFNNFSPGETEARWGERTENKKYGRIDVA